MGIKARFQRKITMTVFRLQCILIITLLSTIGLLVAWPRFRNDAFNLDWYVYLIMVILFSIPLFKKN
jgi:hypothetical protein